MKPRSKKNKGIRLQKWVAKQISLMVNIPWGKDLDIRSREASLSGVDVVLSDKVKKLFKFSIECKNQENWSVHAWIKQAKSNQEKGTDWLLFAKRNNETPVVIMDAEVFFKVYSRNLK